MTYWLSNRGAAIAVALGLIWLAAPAWACGPNMPNSPSGGNNNNGSSSSHDNGDAERQRQNASDAAGEGLDNSNDGGAQRSGGNQNVDNSNQITAATQAQAAANPEVCRQLRAQLADLENYQAVDPYDEARRQRVYFDRVVQMTPARLDQAIAEEKAKLDARIRTDQAAYDKASSRGESPYRVDRSYTPLLSFLLDLKTAQTLGGDQQTAKDQYLAGLSQRSDWAGQDFDRRRDEIRDLRFQIHDNCDQAAAAANTNSSNANQ